MQYEDAVRLAHTWGLLFAIAICCGAALYAFWPGNKREFDEAARLPLEKEEANGERS